MNRYLRHTVLCASLMLATAEANAAFRFDALPIIPLDAGTPSGVALADFDDDGALDAVVTNLSTDTVRILLGDGNGHFALGPTYAGPGTPRAIAVGDVTFDGKPDLVIGSLFAPELVVLFNVGDGTFTTRHFDTPGLTNGVAIGQGIVGGNPMTTIVFTGETGTGAGTYAMRTLPIAGPPVFSSINAVTNAPAHGAIASGNIDGDANDDYVTVGGTPGAAARLVGGASPLFGGALSFNLPADVAIARMDATAFGDAVIAVKGASEISIVHDFGVGGSAVTSSPAGGAPTRVLVADFDDDGINDVAATLTDLAQVTVYRGGGDGTLAPAEIVASDIASQAFASGDVDGDGAIDLVVADGVRQGLTVLLNHSGTVFDDGFE